MNPVRDPLVMYYTYVIQNDKGTWYTGSTGDLRKRLREHNLGRSTWTKGKGEWKIIYWRRKASETKSNLFISELRS